MCRIRVSIAGLLAGIALVGITLAALLHPSRLWGAVFYSMAAGALTIAVMAAIAGRGPRRSFWLGFSGCGWMYFLMIFGPEPISHAGSNLLTEGILDLLYPYTVRSPIELERSLRLDLHSSKGVDFE